MSRIAELVLATAVAGGGIAAMVWWPVDGEPPQTAPATAAADIGAALAPGSAPDTAPAGPADRLPAAPEAPASEPESPALDAHGAAFAFMPPGDLVPGSGDGRTAQINYAPDMRFPLEEGRAFANSQVYGHGGFLGPAGGQCDTANYDYAWRDNFCEARGHDNPMCPAGTGHQGQDIRPGTCQDQAHWAVATTEGTITSIGSYSVRLMGDDGLRYTYLHLDRESLPVAVGDRVVAGQRLGMVSNEFNGTPTTIHLHFEIKMAVETPNGLQNTHVPPYLALVESYQRLLAENDT